MSLQCFRGKRIRTGLQAQGQDKVALLREALREFNHITRGLENVQGVNLEATGLYNSYTWNFRMSLTQLSYLIDGVPRPRNANYLDAAPCGQEVKVR